MYKDIKPLTIALSICPLAMSKNTEGLGMTPPLMLGAAGDQNKNLEKQFSAKLFSNQLNQTCNRKIYL